jgi:hypothetical protein
MDKKCLGWTGHRYDRLHLGVLSREQVRARCLDLAIAVMEREQPDLVISGMALELDTAAAIAARNCGVPLHAAIPCWDQFQKWSKEDAGIWHGLIEYAETSGGGVSAVAETYTVGLMFRRNQVIVNMSTDLASLWNGDRGSGTGDTIRRAEHKQRNGGLRMIQLWESWLKYARNT